MNQRVAKNSRVPSAVGAIPVVGDLVRQADTQAQWLQELVEQNARLVGQLPATMKTFNDSLERFNQTVGRLDRVVTTHRGRDDAARRRRSNRSTPTLDRIAGTLDLPTLREMPEVLDALRREALPALRAATDTQKQVALLDATVERIVALLNDLPGAGIVRRLARHATDKPRFGLSLTSTPRRPRGRRRMSPGDDRRSSVKVAIARVVAELGAVGQRRRESPPAQDRPHPHATHRGHQLAGEDNAKVGNCLQHLHGGQRRDARVLLDARETA